ncbi:hypothetical protein DESC_720233 [Desulfosarcina cetonica]|uniref:hypothetical protein n=1 Tax=Desulfosarcina cetonica TaxID=90730 RepID=UPI0006D08E73|nr:hypothetical protein [Desulfosarcina cetonica]VTR68855.1 hypothetical protein DESC_720233 [Desulfosarcina cetonica]
MTDLVLVALIAFLILFLAIFIVLGVTIGVLRGTIFIWRRFISIPPPPVGSRPSDADFGPFVR